MYCLFAVGSSELIVVLGCKKLFCSADVFAVAVLSQANLIIFITIPMIKNLCNFIVLLLLIHRAKLKIIVVLRYSKLFCCAGVFALTVLLADEFDNFLYNVFI